MTSFLIRNHITIVTIFNSGNNYTSEEEYYINEYTRRKLKNLPADLMHTAILVPF
jgi:hypothetical protein